MEEVQSQESSLLSSQHWTSVCSRSQSYFWGGNTPYTHTKTHTHKHTHRVILKVLGIFSDPSMSLSSVEFC